MHIFLKTFFIFMLSVYSLGIKCQTDTNVYNKKYKLIILKGDHSLIKEVKKFSNKYPDMEYFLTFREPYYRLSVGDCTDFENIKKIKELLKPQYPDSVIEECIEN